jgi:hypothetical protein
MHSAPKIVILFLSALFLFSVLTPESADVQSYDDNCFPAFGESAAAYALCSRGAPGPGDAWDDSLAIRVVCELC